MVAGLTPVRLFVSSHLDYRLEAPADLLLALEVAPTPDQRLIADRLVVTGVEALTPVPGEESIGRRTLTRGAGQITARYHAIVEVERSTTSLAGLSADPPRRVPGAVVPLSLIHI